MPRWTVQVYGQLVAVVAGRVRFEDGFDKWHRDEREDFDQLRYDVGDTLLDAASAPAPPTPSLPACLRLHGHRHCLTRPATNCTCPILPLCMFHYLSLHPSGLAMSQLSDVYSANLKAFNGWNMQLT